MKIQQSMQTSRVIGQVLDCHHLGPLIANLEIQYSLKVGVVQDGNRLEPAILLYFYFIAAK